MRKLKLNFIVIILLLVNFACSRLSNNEIRKSWWKYGSGYHICDALRFDVGNLRGDTIYKNEKPIAIIVSCGRKFFRETAILEIKDIKTDEKGIYHEKGAR